MYLNEEDKKSLQLLSNPSLINDDIYKKLVETTFAVLLKQQQLNNINSLYNSKPDIIKEVHAVLLKLCVELARNNASKQDLLKFLTDCKFAPKRSELFADCYETNKLKLQVVLGNIGSYLPHITDVSWKIEYIVNSSSVDEAEGPLFKIGLSTEAYDSEEKVKKTKVVNFVCNSQELQDLVYKLKDAVRHCQKLANEH